MVLITLLIKLICFSSQTWTNVYQTLVIMEVLALMALIHLSAAAQEVSME